MKKPLLILLLLASLVKLYSQNSHERILVISGGGARGAWGAGLIWAIMQQEKKPNYRSYFANSTGSLMAPLLAIDKLEALKHAYNNTTQSDIFNKNPFNKKGDIKMGNAIFSILCRRKNLGESKNLKKLIQNSFSAQDWEILKKSGKSINIAVVSLTSNQLEIKSSESIAYNDMIDWVWASANQPVFMTAVSKDNQLWVDGGIKENVPITAALEYAKKNNIKVVDVIVNNMMGGRKEPWPKRGKNDRIIQKLFRTIDVFSDEVRNSDILAGILGAQIENTEINIYYMPEDVFRVCPNSLLFKPEILKKLWDSGSNFEVVRGLVVPQKITIGNNSINVYY